MSDVLQSYQRTGRTTRALNHVIQLASQGQDVVMVCPKLPDIKFLSKRCMDRCISSTISTDILETYISAIDGRSLRGLRVQFKRDDGANLGSVSFVLYDRLIAQALLNREGSLGEFVYDPSCFETNSRDLAVLQAYHAYDLSRATDQQRKSPKAAMHGEDYGHRFMVPFSALRGTPGPADADSVLTVNWQTCRDISNESPVHEALQNFSEDQTEDNAVCIIRAVASSIRRRIKGVFE